MPFSLTVTPEWNVIYRIKNEIKNDPLIQKQGQDFMDATMLTAIELCENALKYSDTEGQNVIQFALEIKADQLEIQVSNICADVLRLETLTSTIQQIRNGDPLELYIKRLEVLKDNPDGFSRMGLFRIGYEAEYRLAASIHESQVMVQATRKLEKV
ncbi:MAG: hypothetical protein KDK39_00740 [Leptospiraceae bacterium]|nr:hypothetical protein [Leptospiraceae bacterium]